MGIPSRTSERLLRSEWPPISPGENHPLQALIPGALARACQACQAARQFPFACDALETVANEKHFEVLIGDRFRFQGYIDRLARDSAGRLHVIDYKTGRRAPDRFEGKEADQLEAYALGIFSETEDADELDLVLEFLRPGKTLRRHVRRDEVASIEKRLVARIEVVEDATVFPPNAGTLCDWCGYNDICEAYPLRSRMRLSA